MNFYKILLTYFSKLSATLKFLYTKPAGLFFSVSAIALVTFSKIQLGILLLGFLFILDFITGIWASWMEKKKYEKEHPEEEKKDLILSSKLKMSGVKFVLYGLGILVAFIIEEFFILKSFRLDNISEQDLTLTLCAIGFFCVIEIWSIFIENFKRAGIDIVAKVEKIITTIKDIKNRITE